MQTRMKGFDNSQRNLIILFEGGGDQPSVPTILSGVVGWRQLNTKPSCHSSNFAFLDLARKLINGSKQVIEKYYKRDSAIPMYT